MKGKKIIKFLLLTMAIISTLSITAFASIEIAPRWSYLSSLYGNISISSSGVATITTSCVSNADTVDTVKLNCELQRLDDSWTTQKSWSETSSSYSLLYSKQYAVYKNYSYRLKVTACMYKSGKQLETVTEYFNYGYYH